MSETGGFVGRDTEMARLRAALDAATRMVLVAGDAGVGKTRLILEMTRGAEAAGSIVLSGECLPVSEPLPMLPVASALGALARRDDGALMESALRAAPGYARGEVGRLLPQYGPGETGHGGDLQRSRLFAGIAALLTGLAQLSPVCVVVEDVHWADAQTLDLLTFLARSATPRVTFIVTCRGDEFPLSADVADWLAATRAAAGMEEITLGPLSPADTGALVTALTGHPVLPELAAELHVRAEGNPFFTEQLVAATLADATAGHPLAVPAGLPPRLAGLLTARADRCAGPARQLLAALSVAGRPLQEEQLRLVTGLDRADVRNGLRELLAAKLLSGEAESAAYRPRHALLAEAVAQELLPGERVGLHERTASTLAMTADRAMAADIAGHWQAAGRATEELGARRLAAEAAEQVFAYAEAADHWQRAVVLSTELSAETSAATRKDQPGLYLGAIDALSFCGNRLRARALAEDAYDRFADHPDPATAAAVLVRVGTLRDIDGHPTARPLLEKALELFERCPPSAEKTGAWFRYAGSVFHADGQLAPTTKAFTQAAKVAEAAGDKAMTGRALTWLANCAFLGGQIDEGHVLLNRGLALAAADDEAALRVADYRCGFLLTLGRLREAADAGLDGLAAGRRAGLHATMLAGFVAAATAEALIELGCTAEAAVVIDPWTQGEPDRDHFSVHERRAQLDLLRGNTAAAVERQRQISALSFAGSINNARHVSQDAAQLALWAGRPADAIAEVRRILPRFKTPDLTILCGHLLTTGLRACADLAGQARARGDSHALGVALDDASALQSWVREMAGAPFTDHAYVAAIPAQRAVWEAELTRLAGSSDPALWVVAAEAWRDLGYPHRAGYAWWRQAQAQLDAGEPASRATAALRAAATAAAGHAPLLSQVRQLAERARIALSSGSDGAGRLAAIATPQQPVPYGLTSRELAVLRLVATGRTNAQIGAELYISPSTAGVHVSSILRKLGVAGRVQAAAAAERAGLLSPP